MIFGKSYQLSHLIQNCVTSWHEFPYFHKITFTRNMRALSNETEFVEFLKKNGNAEAPQFPQFGENIIEIHPTIYRR